MNRGWLKISLFLHPNTPVKNTGRTCQGVSDPMPEKRGSGMDTPDGTLLSD
jgi:hypothetical protein